MFIGWTNIFFKPKQSGNIMQLLTLAKRVIILPLQAGKCFCKTCLLFYFWTPLKNVHEKTKEMYNSPQSTGTHAELLCKKISTELSWALNAVNDFDPLRIKKKLGEELKLLFSSPHSSISGRKSHQQTPWPVHFSTCLPPLVHLFVWRQLLMSVLLPPAQSAQP